MYKFYFEKSKGAVKQHRLALCCFSSMAAVFLCLNPIPGRAEPEGGEVNFMIPNDCSNFFFYSELTILKSDHLQSFLFSLLWLNLFHQIFIEFCIPNKQCYGHCNDTGVKKSNKVSVPMKIIFYHVRQTIKKKNKMTS